MKIAGHEISNPLPVSGFEFKTAKERADEIRVLTADLDKRKPEPTGIPEVDIEQNRLQSLCSQNEVLARLQDTPEGQALLLYLAEMQRALERELPNLLVEGSPRVGYTQWSIIFIRSLIYGLTKLKQERRTALGWLRDHFWARLSANQQEEVTHG